MTEKEALATVIAELRQQMNEADAELAAALAQLAIEQQKNAELQARLDDIEKGNTNGKVADHQAQEAAHL